MERRVSRWRVVVWLFAALVIAAILVLGGALVIADRSRGPAGPGVDQVLEAHAYQHWQSTLQDRGVPEARSRRLYDELADHTRKLGEITRAVYGPPPYPGWDFPSLTEVVPIWEPSRFPRLPENFNETLDYERGRENNAAFLQLARDRGILDTLLGIRSYEGASSMPERSGMFQFRITGIEASVIASLLGMAYIEAVESGDEAGAVAAAKALDDAAAVFAKLGPRSSSPNAFVHTQNWLVRSTIELGLMTPSLARSLLDETEPLDAAALRVGTARLSILDELQWIAVGDMTDWTDGPLYGGDGRVRFAPAFLSVFRAVPARENRSLTLPRIGFERRHATLEELAEYLDKYAEACEVYFASSRADRSVDMLRVTPPSSSTAVVFPVGIESLWLGMASHRDQMDEVELLQHTTTIALAIEVYRGEHAGPPASLEDLVPGVLTALPRNTWNNGGDWLYSLDAKSPLGYKLTIPDRIGPHNEGVLSGEWPSQPRSFVLHDSEFFIMPSAPYDFGP